jgi:carbamoyl-phosphate synthase small subunit
VVIRDYSEHYSNFRATGALEDVLRENGVVGIRGVDTRAVTVHLRDHGEMRAAIVPADADRDAALAKLRETPSPFEGDLLADLALAKAVPADSNGGPSIAVLDLGVTRSLLAQLAALGCAVTVVPASAGAEDVLATGAAGLIAAGGPGDPRQATTAVKTLGDLLGKLPVLGIGLGHQALALALGGSVIRMKPGHHGVNIPVRDLVRGACAITGQHHSFAVDPDSLPDTAEVTHVNVNDRTVEGVRSKDHPAASIQFHPTEDEHGRPSAILAEFVKGPRAVAE